MALHSFLYNYIGLIDVLCPPRFGSKAEWTIVKDVGEKFADQNKVIQLQSQLIEKKEEKQMM